MDRSKRLTERLMMLDVGEVEVFDNEENPVSIRVAATRLKKQTDRIYATRKIKEGIWAVRLK